MSSVIGSKFPVAPNRSSPVPGTIRSSGGVFVTEMRIGKLLSDANESPPEEMKLKVMAVSPVSVWSTFPCAERGARQQIRIVGEEEAEGVADRRQEEVIGVGHAEDVSRELEGHWRTLGRRRRYEATEQ